MKLKFILPLLVLLSCNENDSESKSSAKDTAVNTTEVKEPARDSPGAVENEDTVSKTYSNARFKEVTIERLGDTRFRVKGKGQIFEANFGWVIEDGHNELNKGFVMTDAGAPEWGNFDFTVEAKKDRPNSTLHLILFETSMKDGSRQHELPIRLY